MSRPQMPSGLTLSGEWLARNPSEGAGLGPLALGALGIVYGDIGTSPLYALRECFHGPHAIVPTQEHVLGVLSLIFWSLILVVSIKYIAVIMRADNEGEGGILALMALVTQDGDVANGEAVAGWRGASLARTRAILLALGLFGAALLYGDGAITPAISVLSAVEGLKIAAPGLSPFVVPITIVILLALFAIQRRGTGTVGRIFGPVMLIWFLAIGAVGVVNLLKAPEVLRAFDPSLGVRFLLKTGYHGFLVLGSVVLVVTGGEALYADMGHFGKRPIRAAWFGLVLPALALNYLGQGAAILTRPEAAENPFFFMVPGILRLPMIALATLAAVIAAQALISGAFSITRQAVQLGYLPRIEIRHTSAQEIGQIYVPQVNWAICAGTIGLVLGFRSSSALAGAYGIAVTLTMVITMTLGFVAMRRLWRWSALGSVLIAGFFLAIDLAFLGANSLKIAEGGWFPLVVGAGVFALMSTWIRGRRLLGERIRERVRPLEDFFAEMERKPPVRVPGCAVYLTSSPAWTPPALAKNLQHNKVLHEQVILLRVETHKIPHIPPGRRIEVAPLGPPGFYRLTAHVGFMEDPNVPALLELARGRAPKGFVPCGMADTTFVVGRETLLATERYSGMSRWREELFAFMSRHAQRAAAFYAIPSDRVLEIGSQVEL